MKDEQEYRYKPAGGLLAGFLCVSMFLYPVIVRAAYVRQSRQNSIVQYAQPESVCIVQSVQFPTFQTISIFLQIRLDSSN